MESATAARVITSGRDASPSGAGCGLRISGRRPWRRRRLDNYAARRPDPKGSAASYSFLHRGCTHAAGVEEVVQGRSGDSGDLRHSALGDTKIEQLPDLGLPSVEP